MLLCVRVAKKQVFIPKIVTTLNIHSKIGWALRFLSKQSLSHYLSSQKQQ